MQLEDSGARFHAASTSIVSCGSGAISAHRSVSALKRRKRRGPIRHQLQCHPRPFMNCIVTANVRVEKRVEVDNRDRAVNRQS